MTGPKSSASATGVTVTASVTVETLPQYRGEGPVLHAIEVVPAEKAKEDIVYFN